MANRRMLSKFVFENDDFLDMPAESQALYAHLVINADDDGFIDHPNAIRRMTGFSVDSLKLLIAKGFLLPFSDSLVVVAHWEMQNHIQPSKKTPTVYTGQKEMLTIDEQGIYRKLSDNFRRNAGEMPVDSMILSETLTDNVQINSGYNNTAINSGNQAIQQYETNYQTISGEVPANSQHSIVQDSIVQDSINNNCAKSSYPEAQEVIDMYNNTCTSLTLSPNIEIIGEQWDGKYKGLYEAINKCIPLTNPTITTNEFKAMFETAEGMSEQIKKSSKEDGCTNELEFILNRMLKAKEKVTA
jgi:hypothetical protein